MSQQFKTNILILSGQDIRADNNFVYLNGEPIGTGISTITSSSGSVAGISGMTISNRHYTLDFLGVDYQTGTITQNTIFRTINRTPGATITTFVKHVGLNSGWNFAFPSGSSSGFTWIGGVQPLGIGSGKMGVLALTCLGTFSNQIVGTYAEQLI